MDNHIDKDISRIKELLKEAYEEDDIDRKRTLIQMISSLSNHLFIKDDAFNTDMGIRFKDSNKEYGLQAYRVKKNGGYETILGIRYKDLIIKL